MELRSSVVHRNLDAKLKVVGLEIYDLLFVLLVAMVMNLIFGKTFLALYLAFLLPVAMGITLYFVKRDKPEDFLIHWARYQVAPGFYGAGEDTVRGQKAQRRIDD